MCALVVCTRELECLLFWFMSTLVCYHTLWCAEVWKVCFELQVCFGGHGCVVGSCILVHFGSLGVTKIHSGELGVTRVHLDSLGCTWRHSGSLRCTSNRSGSLGFTRVHLGLLGFTWVHLGSLGFTRCFT